MAAEEIPKLQLLGAGGFGAIIGWYVYYINRYRKGDVQLSDVVTLIGILGGAAVQALFKPDGALFGAYGVGLFCGFFSYFLFLLLLVAISRNFKADWFLDGRRKVLDKESYIPDGTRLTGSAMGGAGGGAGGAAGPGIVG